MYRLFVCKVLMFVFNFRQSVRKVISPVRKTHNKCAVKFSATSWMHKKLFDITYSMLNAHLTALWYNSKLTGVILYWHQNDLTVVGNWLLGHSAWFCFYSKRRGPFDEAVGTPTDSHRSGRWQKQLCLRLETVFIYASVSWGLCSVGPVAFRFKHNHTNWSFSSHLP